MKILLQLLIIAILITLFCGGCSSDSKSKAAKHPLVIKAALLYEKGEFQEAIDYYKKYLQKRSNSPDIHLKIACIYDENLQDPISAIYHYREFLNLCDNPQERKDAELFLKLCEENISAKKQDIPLATLPQVPEKEGITAKEEPQSQQSETPPKKVVEKPANPTPETTPPPISHEEKTVAPKQQLQSEFPPLELDEQKDELPTEYVVKKGDTLSGISKKFYGTIKHYRKIMQANNMTNANQLKTGKTLIIPKIE